MNIDVHCRETIETFGSEVSDLSSMAVRRAVESIEVNGHILQRRVDSEIDTATLLGRNGDNIG